MFSELTALIYSFDKAVDLAVQRVHCGCIVSLHAFVVLDAGGIECMLCANKYVTLVSKPYCFYLYMMDQSIFSLSIDFWRT